MPVNMPPPPTHMAPPPLPQKALAEMVHISKLLNAQAELARQGRTKGMRRPDSKNQNIFKMPMPPPMGTNSKLSGGVKSPSLPDSDDEVVDMDVASPEEDDELLLSFSPPPIRPPEPKEKPRSRTFDRIKRDSRREDQRERVSTPELARSVEELTNQDEPPASAVELDKQNKVKKNNFMPPDV